MSLVSEYVIRFCMELLHIHNYAVGTFFALLHAQIFSLENIQRGGFQLWEHLLWRASDYMSNKGKAYDTEVHTESIAPIGEQLWDVTRYYNKMLAAGVALWVIAA